MRDFISKDSSFAEISKQIKKLRKDLRSAEKKASDRVTKLLSERLKVAISAHKWKILNRDEYPNYSYNPDEAYYEICLSRVSTGKKTVGTSSGGLMNPSALAARITHVKATRAAGNGVKMKSPKRKVTSYSPKEVKNYDDLIHFGERWDIFQVKRGKCLVKFRYDNLRITSYLGMEEVFLTMKELGIPLDLSHHVQDLEKSERELDLKRSLVKDLYSKMLFPVG